MLLATPAEARCYSIWHYKTPQRCHATPVRHQEYNGNTANVLPPERIEFALPALEWIACPEADERLMGIAKLRDLDKDQAPR